jgi:hypothetical protein
MFSCANRPNTLSDIETITSPPSTTSLTLTPIFVLQSSSVILASCATSQSLS